MYKRQALLKEAGCTFDDLGQMIVYLRDVADYTVVKGMYDERFPDTPRAVSYTHLHILITGRLIKAQPLP